MKNLFSSIYLVSKLASAAITVLSVAVFTRLVGQDVFGQYLVSFAFSFIAYSIAAQWLLGAHFGQQSRSSAGEVAAGAVILTGVSVLVGLVLIALSGMAGLIDAKLIGPTALLLIGLATHFLANEIGRAQLLVGAVTLGALLRALGTLVLGSLALWQFKTASALLIAVAMAHIIAAIPVVLGLFRTSWSEGFPLPDRAIYARLWRYGWPLIFAGGAASLALYVDRLLLERFFGMEAVGAYGATLDFVKQSFVIVGETIAVSYVSRAKYLHADAHREEAQPVLRLAFVTAAFLAAFGIVFYVLLGNTLFTLLLDSKYLDALPLLPLLAVGNALLMLRAYYFAQTIYFINSVRLELVSMIIALIVGSALGLWLVPAYGLAGAATAFTLTQLAALLVFLISPETRSVMPVDLIRLTILGSAALATVGIGEVIKNTLPEMVAVPANVVLIALISGYLAIRWDLFDAAQIASGSWRKLKLLFNQD